MTKTDATFFKLYHLTYKYENQRMAENTVNDLEWYVNTARASAEFCNKLCSLKGNQRAALLRRMMKAEYTTDAHVRAAREYLNA